MVILQPGYLPWLGYFDQLAKSDAFVFLDDAQYTKNDWRNRNRIKGPNGVMWLTVPVKRSFPQLIKDATIVQVGDWARKHQNSLRHSYGKAPYFADLFAGLQAVYQKNFAFLLDLDVALADNLARYMGLSPNYFFSSHLGVEGKATERLIEICKLLKATHYLTGNAAMNYLDESLFREAGIQVEYQNYLHPVYNQLHGPFVPYLSAVDLLFNHGPRSLEIITGNRSPKGGGK